jgi:hypothetical protein
MNQKEQLGWTLFTVGFLVAAATAMKLPPLWEAFVPSIIMACGGAIIARSGAMGGAHDEDMASGIELNPVDLAKAMIKNLSRISGTTSPEKAKEIIEEVQNGDVADFVDQRRIYMKKYGPAKFAHFFGSFAKGERSVNRAWSALIDDHPQEMHDSLRRAANAFREVISSFDGE